MGIITFIGVLGAVIILVFFLLNQFKIITVDGLWYDGGNLIGASMLLFYAIDLSSIPFILINAVWAIFSLKDVILDIRK